MSKQSRRLRKQQRQDDKRRLAHAAKAAPASAPLPITPKADPERTTTPSDEAMPDLAGEPGSITRRPDPQVSAENDATSSQASLSPEKLAVIDAAIDAVTKQASTLAGESTSLPLKVAPFIVRELGINLYTSLARVLVEFVANAWDADANEVDIFFNEAQIRHGMDKLRKEEAVEKAKRSLAKCEADGQAVTSHQATGAAMAVAIGTATDQVDGQDEPKEPTLDDCIKIIVKDRGQGMTLDELRDKFLFVGRRRREHHEIYTRNKRVVMGRKGIGKLAGFGVAHKVTVITKCAGTETALRIEMLYEDIVAARDTTDIKIPAVPVAWTETYPTGTTVILSGITAVSTKSRLKTVEETIAENFHLILNVFTIRVNGNPVKPPIRKYDFAFPTPDLPADQLVKYAYKPLGEDGPSYDIEYRIRFTGPCEHLKSEDRGIAIYAHNRLAAAPDLLNLTTGMHGFKNTSYLTGVVRADFIDDQKVDYIASNRQGVRWETPLLEPLKEFLTTQMEMAVKAYQKKKDGRAGDKAKTDLFTVKTIEAAGLPPNRKRLAFKIAKAIIMGDPDEEKAPYYKAALPILVNGLAQGAVMTAIHELAKQDHPQLRQVIAQIIRLTAKEYDDFVLFVKGRLDGIGALKKIIHEADWSKPDNEKELQRLLEKCPWIIDQMPQAFTADVSLSSVVDKLAKELKIAKYAEVDPKDAETRPDLTFLLHSEGLAQLVMVELKSPNLPLRNEHLTQLEKYMLHARDWLAGQGFGHTRVVGYLIGMLKPESKSADVRLLYDKMKRHPHEDWKVYGLMELLERSETAHKEILVAAKSAEAAGDDEDEEDEEDS